MLPFIFGRPKQTSGVPPPPVSHGPSESTLATIHMLSEKESDLEKRINMLSKQVDVLTKEAVEHHKAGMKTKALIAMKKKNIYEDQIKTNTSMMMRIIEQKTALESTAINSDTLAAINHATIAMKAEQANWSVDRIKDLNDETQEVYAAHREINDLLLEPIGEPHDDELLEELEGLVAADRLSPAPTAPSADPILALPAVPTSVISAPAAPQCDDEILAELRRLVPA